MIQTALIRNAHQDLVSDAAYDMYGLYLATCGLDQRIKVWSLDESSGSWNLEDEWKAHDAAITKIDWAHAEFGSIVATSSFDRTVRIWEQVSLEPSTSTATAPSSGAPNSASNPQPCRWAERAILTEAKGSVRAVQFAPHHFGLKLASISSDNHLRIYECLEQPSLASWQLADEVDVLSLPTTLARHHHAHGGGQQHHSSSSFPHSLATSTPTPNPNNPSSSNLNNSSSMVMSVDGTSTTSLTASLLAAQQQQQQSQNQGQQGNRPGAGVREADGGWCLAWCKDRYWGEIVAVGAGTSGVIRVVQFSSHRRPQTLLALDPPTPSSSSSSAAFTSGISNSLGRSGSRPAAGAAGTNLAAGGSTNASKDKDNNEADNTDSANSSSNKTNTYAVTSVSWAPSCGRSFHLIATGSRDGRVRIWKVKPPQPPPPTSAAADDTMDIAMVDEKWSASLVGEFDDHKTHVGRVEWNVTGTVLASSGNDGRVRLWKQTVGGIWRSAGQVSVEQSAEAAGDVDMGENGGAE